MSLLLSIETDRVDLIRCDGYGVCLTTGGGYGCPSRQMLDVLSDFGQFPYGLVWQRGSEGCRKRFRLRKRNRKRTGHLHLWVAFRHAGNFWEVWVYEIPSGLFNIAMENDPFIDDFPIHTSIYKGFSMAMLNHQMVCCVVSKAVEIALSKEPPASFSQKYRTFWTWISRAGKPPFHHVNLS